MGTVTLSLRVRDPSALSTVALRLRAQDRSTNVSSTLELELPAVAGGTDTGWREPARVHMKFPYGEPSDPPSSVSGPFTIEGRVEAATGLDWAEIRLGNDKVFSVSPQTAETDSHAPTVIELECEAIPEAGPNRISVRAQTSDGVTTTRNYWVLGKKDSN